MLDPFRDGDLVVITAYDCLARSLRNLLDIVEVSAKTVLKLPKKGRKIPNCAEDVLLRSFWRYPNTASSSMAGAPRTLDGVADCIPKQHV